MSVNTGFAPYAGDLSQKHMERLASFKLPKPKTPPPEVLRDRSPIMDEPLFVVEGEICEEPPFVAGLRPWPTSVDPSKKA